MHNLQSRHIDMQQSSIIHNNSCNIINKICKYLIFSLYDIDYLEEMHTEGYNFIAQHETRKSMYLFYMSIAVV